MNRYISTNDDCQLLYQGSCFCRNRAKTLPPLAILVSDWMKIEKKSFRQIEMHKICNFIQIKFKSSLQISHFVFVLHEATNVWKFRNLSLS